MKQTITRIVLAGALIIGVAACSSDSTETTAATATEAAAASTEAAAATEAPSTEAASTEASVTEAAAVEAPETVAAAAAATAFPFTFDNCGEPVTLDASPKKLVLTEASAVATLDAVGALDRVIARTGEYPPEYFSAEVNAKLAKIPALTSTQGSTGGIEISLETIIDAGPDLVIGYETETIKREGLAKAGIDLYVIPPFCDTAPPVSFASIYDEVRLYGKFFENETGANAAADALKATVDATSSAVSAVKGKKAAALYVSSDGSALYAYSSLGMVHPQMEALGLVNVFAELKERVPEVSIEELLNRDPEVLILLYTDTKVTPEKITSLVADLPGAKGMAALSGGKVVPFLFNFSEPPSPLVVDGLGRLATLLAN